MGDSYIPSRMIPPHSRSRRPRRPEPVRLCLMALGWLLLVLGPLIGGPFPGPFGIIGFAAGLALLLQNSHWARRQYVRGKRRYPRTGHWMDRGLRRGPRPKAPAAPSAD